MNQTVKLSDSFQLVDTGPKHGKQDRNTVRSLKLTAVVAEAVEEIHKTICLPSGSLVRKHLHRTVRSHGGGFPTACKALVIKKASNI